MQSEYINRSITGGDEYVRESELATYRKAYLNHERWLKSIGVIWIGSGILTLGAGAAILAISSREEFESMDALFGVGMIVFMGILGFIAIAGGIAMCALNKAAQPLIGLASIFSLIEIPFGTALGIVSLFLIFSEKASTVFSKEYHETIRATRQVQSGPYVLIWVFVVVVSIPVILATTAMVLAALSDSGFF